MEELMVCGNQKFMGKEIPVVLGGFGAGKKCVCDKTIAEIHDMGAFKVRERISNNISRFRENIDFIDLKQGILEADTSEDQGMGERHALDFVLELGYTKSAITQAEHIYLLSERGYAKLIKIMDTDLAWAIHDKLIDEYFMLRESGINRQQLSPQMQMLMEMVESQARQELKQKQQEKEMLTMRDDIKRLEAKVTTHNEDYYTVAGYASLRGLNVDINRANMIGRKASRMSREYDYPIEKAKDARFGAVNTYHVDILKEVFKR